jgi:hypothetical protein
MPLSVSSEVDSPTVNGIREMSQVRLEKRQKAWLVEAVCACMAHIDLIESKDGNDEVRLELRELKKAVFVNASHGSAAYTQYTQDYMDRADTGWDAILKLAAEQTQRVEDLMATQEDGDKSGEAESDRLDKESMASSAVTRDRAPAAASASTSVASAGPTNETSKRTSDTKVQKSRTHRSVCTVMMGGGRCDDSGCNFRHPRVCDVHTSATRPRDCKLWHFHSLLSKQSGGTTGNSGGHPTRVLSNAEVKLTKQNDRLKNHIATLGEHSQKRKEKAQRATQASQQATQQPWNVPPNVFPAPPVNWPALVATATPTAAAPPPDLATMSNTMAVIMASVHQMQQQMAALAAR